MPFFLLLYSVFSTIIIIKLLSEKNIKGAQNKSTNSTEDLDSSNISADLKPRTYKLWINFFLVSAGIGFTALIYYDLVTANFTTPGNSTEFGDLFGGLSAIFAGLAFAGVIITLKLQIEELILTRNELSKSAYAQHKSQEALNAQLKSMQQTSLIESMKSYVEKRSERGPEADAKINLALQIIRIETEKLFKNEAYLTFTRGQFEVIDQVSSLPQNPNQVNLRLIFRNTAVPSHEIKMEDSSFFDKLALPRNKEVIYGTKVFEASKNYNRNALPSPSEFSTFIYHKDVILGNTYKQKLHIKLPPKGNPIITMSEPELVE